jgi:cephalosporin-C deacetylase
LVPTSEHAANFRSMPNIDLPLEQLRTYSPGDTEPPDFDEFWSSTLEQARRDAGSDGPALEIGDPYRPLSRVEANQVWMTGLGGGRVAGWYVRPSGSGPFPGIAHFHGYSGRGARPLEVYALAAQGVAVLSIDCRGQGGRSPDVPAVDGGHRAGWLTRGLDDPAKHYYRYVFSDVVLAVEALCSRDEVDTERVAVTGMSQGGGLSLAAAALSGKVSFVWSDEPFLSDFPRAVEITPNPPYTEVSDFVRARPELEGTVFRTLAYMDVANHARRVRCPAVVTVGLWDEICPPSSVFAAFNRLASTDKELVVFPFHGHQVTYDIDERRFSWLLERLGASPSQPL